MARYTGPRVRISRRFGVPIFGPSKYLERRNYGPGVHGPKSRRKHTDYALGLIEKQKLRYYYGLLERQFRGVYERALKRRKVNIPSYSLKVNDTVEAKESNVSRQLATKGLEISTSRAVPDWLSLNKDTFKGVLMRIPSRDDIQPIANEQAVVEFYSR